MEITLLGRGVGESCLVHAGDGQWIIVDTFNDGAIPAAQRYLDALHVDPSAVAAIVLTHFHADHTRGVGRLFDYYDSAFLMVTDALRHESFRQLYNDDADQPLLGEIPPTIKRARRRVIGNTTLAFSTLKVSSTILRRGHAQVVALSPVEAAVDASATELARVLAGRVAERVRTQLADDNRCSIALHVRVHASTAILGADLIAHPRYGWQAVVDDPRNQNLSVAQIVKIPHHGSANADHDSMWDRFVEPAASMMVAPFWPSGLPREADCLRLRMRGELWQAAPSQGYVQDEFGNRIARPVEVGIVQARRKRHDIEWRVGVKEPAFQVP